MTPRRQKGQWTTVVSDTLDQAAFQRYLDGSAKLQSLDQRGEEALPTFEGLMFDLHAAFLYPTPVMRPAGQVLPSHRLNATVVKQLMELPEYKEIHPSTETDTLLSAMALLEVGEAVIGIITEEQQEQIRQMQQMEQEIDQLQQAADQAQHAADDAQQQAQQAAAQAQNGKPQQQAAAELAQQQARATQTRANQAMQTLEEARAQLEAMASALSQELNQPEQRARMRQAIRSAVGDLNQQVKEEKDLLELWGFDPGEVKTMDYETIDSLAKQLQAKERLIKIAELLGGLKPFWQGRLRQKEQVGVELTDETYLGSDLENVHPAELLELVDPELEDLFHLKYAEEALFCTRTRTKVRLGEGPGIILRDRSGSMEDGGKEIWAAALELAVTNMVTRDKRATAHIWFTATSEPIEVVECFPRGSGMQARRYLVEWQNDSQKVIPGSEQTMTYFEAYVYIATQGRSKGGTEFDPPVQWLLEVLKAKEFARSDGLILTDGQADLKDENIQKVNKLRAESNLHMQAVLINTGTTSAASVNRFADVKTVTQLTVEVAGEIINTI